MSQAKNHLRWCINKAKAEIQKGEKQRGIVESSPDIKMAKSYIKKAEHNLEVFLYNKEGNYFDWVINIGFYVFYHCFLAVLSKFGYESRNQECTFSAIEFLIEEKKIESKFKEYIDFMKSGFDKEEDSLLPLREFYQYTPSIEVEQLKVERLENMCKSVLRDTKTIIES